MRRFLTALFLLVITGCGGGSAGTGTEVRVLTGKIQLENGSPVSGASVTISQTGESTTSDSTGTFRLETESQEEQLQLIVEKDNISNTVEVDFLQDGSGELSLTITVDPGSTTGTISGLDVRVKIVGVCDQFFENTRTIRQSTRAPQGVTCTLRVSLRSSRGGLPNRAYALQKRGCSDKRPWKLVTSGSTSDNGVGTSTFRFFNDSENCLYRVLVPLNDNEVNPIEFDIQTFTYQDFIQ